MRVNRPGALEVDFTGPQEYDAATILVIPLSGGRTVVTNLLRLMRKNRIREVKNESAEESPNDYSYLLGKEFYNGGQRVRIVTIPATPAPHYVIVESLATGERWPFTLSLAVGLVKKSDDLEGPFSKKDISYLELNSRDNDPLHKTAADSSSLVKS